MLVDDAAELKQVTLYTDGACQGNPGPGGYGAILVYGEKRREISAGYRLTTNNRMEILAVISGLETLRYPCAVTVYTDSQYVANSMSKGWARRWRDNGWMRNAKERAINVDLWDKMLSLCEKHKISFIWVRGHAGHPENERCDALSVAAAKNKDLLIDEVYERENR